MAIKRCHSPFSIWTDGVPRVIAGGQLIEDSDPAYKGHEHLFEDVQTFVSERRAPLENAAAAPGEKRSLTAPAESSTAFEPGEHTTPDVLAYLATADEAEAVRVLDAEAAGQDRKGISKNRDAILEAARANNAAAPSGDE